MAFWDDIDWGDVAVESVLGGPMYGQLTAGQDVAQSQQGREAQRQRDMANERWSRMLEGMQMGQQEAESITGMTSGDVGSRVRDITSTYEERAKTPSAAAGRVRRAGQTRQAQLRARGGTQAERESSAYTAAQMAGEVEDRDAERRLGAYRSLIGNLMRTHSALKPAYSSLAIASQYIEPPKQNTGLLSGLALV